jgi:hypothetical protein
MLRSALPLKDTFGSRESLASDCVPLVVMSFHSYLYPLSQNYTSVAMSLPVDGLFPLLFGTWGQIKRVIVMTRNLFPCLGLVQLFWHVGVIDQGTIQVWIFRSIYDGGLLLVEGCLSRRARGIQSVASALGWSGS